MAVNEIEVIRTFIGISLLVFTAKLLAGVFDRYKIPGIIGEVLAGIIFGPYALGGAISFFGEPLVQLNEMTLSLAFIGGIVVLFSAGLEFTFGDVIRAGPPALLIGVIEVIVVFTSGFFLPLALGYSWTFALIIATALTATSVAISVRLLSGVHALQSTEAKIIVNTAIMDDILGLAILSVVTSVVLGGIALNLSTILFRIVLILLIWFALLAISSFLIPRAVKAMRIGSWDYAGTAESIAIIVCFGFSFLTAYIGLSPIVGAFAAGVAITGSRILVKTKELVKHLNLIFGTIFFAMIGAQIDLGVFRHLDYLLFVLLFAVAVLNKIVGCGIPSILYFRSVKKGLRVGYGMISRGEVGLIVAGVGLTASLIDQNVYVALVATCLATTFVSPFLMNRSYRESVSIEDYMHEE